MTRAAPIGPRADRATPWAMAAGVGVSVLAHAGAAWWLGVVPSSAATGPPTPVQVDQADPAEPPPDAPRLGLDLPHNASIAWLGVREDPLEGRSPESEVEQAQLSPAPGETPTPAVPPPTLVPPQPEPEPAAAEPAPDQPASRATPPALAPPEPAESPVLTLPEPRDPPDEPAERLTEPPDPQEPTPEPRADPAEMGPPAPPRPRPAEPPAEPTPPAPEGSSGEPDPRAADAAMRRRADPVDVSRLGRPLQASGDLEITTVRPTWSLQVRNAYSPRRNPFMEIRFGRDGRVRSARFVPLPDGTRGSGYAEVDQPLLNAVYRWTAKGKAIERLDPDDPDATHGVVMRFLLVAPPPGEDEDE